MQPFRAIVVAVALLGFALPAFAQSGTKKGIKPWMVQIEIVLKDGKDMKKYKAVEAGPLAKVQAYLKEKLVGKKKKLKIFKMTKSGFTFILNDKQTIKLGTFRKAAEEAGEDTMVHDCDLVGMLSLEIDPGGSANPPKGPNDLKKAFPGVQIDFPTKQGEEMKFAFKRTVKLIAMGTSLRKSFKMKHAKEDPNQWRPIQDVKWYGGPKKRRR